MSSKNYQSTVEFGSEEAPLVEQEESEDEYLVGVAKRNPKTLAILGMLCLVFFGLSAGLSQPYTAERSKYAPFSLVEEGAGVEATTGTVMEMDDLSGGLAQKMGVSQEQASEGLEYLLDTIMNAVAAGDKVSLGGFGKFRPELREQRVGRNPYTGEKVYYPAYTVAKFTPGETFKGLMNP